MAIKTTIAAAFTLVAVFGTSAFAQNWTPQADSDPQGDGPHYNSGRQWYGADSFAQQYRTSPRGVQSNGHRAHSPNPGCNVWGSTMQLPSCEY